MRAQLLDRHRLGDVLLEVNERFAQAIDTMETQQTLARVLTGAGGVLAAVGGVLIVTSSLEQREKPKPGGLALACAPTRCQATYSGKF